MKKTFGDIVLIIVLGIGIPMMAISAVFHVDRFIHHAFTSIPCGKDGELKCRPMRR